MATPILKHLVQLNAFDNIVGVEGPLSQVEALAVSAVGSNTVGVLSNNQSILPSNTVTVAAAAGSGAYTSTVILSATNHLAGDKTTALVTFAASANPTVVVKNATSGGTTLLTLTNAAAGVIKYYAEFIYSGTAWVLAASNEVSAVGPAIPGDAGSFTTLAASGATSLGSTLAVTGASTIAALSATSGAFSTTLGVTGASTLAAVSATSGAFSTTLGVTGLATLTGGLVGGVQSLSGAGAVNLTTLATDVTSTGANALTLANGTNGQIKIITMIVDGGDATLTPTTKTGFTTITFNDVGDSAMLQYHTTLGWMLVGTPSASAA